MKRMKKYRTVLVAAGVFALLIMLFPMLNAHATPETLIFWEDTSKTNEVLVSLALPGKAPLDEASTLELTFHLEGQEMESVAFLFDKEIVKDTGISVKEFRYNEDTNDLKVFLSGRGTLIKKGEKLTLGRIQVVSENDLKISVAKEQCRMVDQYHDMKDMADLGEISVYEMKMKEEATTESSEQETTQPDVTKPDVTEPDVTEPDITKPDITEPDVTKPDITVPETKEDNSDADDEKEKSAPNKNWILSGNVWQFKKPGGTLAKNEWAMVDGKWYHFNEEGTMQTGWIFSNGSWYNLNPSGEMQTGWIFDGGKWYFCGASGAMKTGWIQDKTVWYHLQPSGAMDTGWVQHDGKWYYMGADGRMLTNTVTEDGYHLDRNGVCAEKQQTE